MGKILLSLLFFNLTFSAFSQDEKPNIIFILTDDHRWDALDPLESNNLAADPLYQEILEELRTKMEQKIAAFLKAKIQ
jgi:hypothetical protein